MIDYNEINQALKTLQVRARDIKEMKKALDEKFNLYFDSREAQILEKITTPTLTTILKKINTIHLTKTGELTIDTFFLIQKDLQTNIIKLHEDEFEVALELLEKILIITGIKVDESEELTYKEKFEIFDLIIRNLEKLLMVHATTLSEAFPNAEVVLKALRKKFVVIEVKKPPRKSMSNKMRARLQKEINSKCPFCEDEEVEHFDGHHIDEDRSNTVFGNMLLVCKKCHSKIGEGTITRQQVEDRKANLNSSGGNIEIFKISVSSENNCWKPYPNLKHAFQLDWEAANDFPIFQFHLVNNYNKTIVLADIDLQVKHLFSGFGDLPQPCAVPKSNVYNILIESQNRVHM